MSIRRAPSPSSRATSAALWSSEVEATSRCTRFLDVLGSGTGTNTSGSWPAWAGSSSGGSITTSSGSSKVIGHFSAADQNRANPAGSAASTTRWTRRVGIGPRVAYLRRELSISRLPVCLLGDHPREGGNHAVRAADLPRRQPLDRAAGSGAEADLRRVGGGQQAARPDRRPADGASRERHHRAGAGRQDADHRRPVRRDQGGGRRLRRPRGRRPRRGDRAGRADPDGPPGRRHRDPPGREVLVATLEQVFRDHWGRVLATLIGFLGDFDLAEEAAQEAFAIAAERWQRDGVPDNPRAWLVTTARNRASVPRPRADDGEAARAGEEEDQGGRDPVPGAARPRPSRPPRRRARGRLP